MDEKLKRERKKKADKIIEAYTKEDFQNKLKENRMMLDEQIQKITTHLRTRLPKINILKNIESRIKEPDSLREKIHRKNYFAVADTHPIEEGIYEKLEDILGFRIGCFFYKEEKEIYDELKKIFKIPDDGKWLTSKEFPEFAIDFTDDIKQQNEFDLFKVKGCYKKEHKFELQIKSILHHLWGEVDHKTVYKDDSYDSRLKLKKKIEKESHYILQAVDKNLEFLYNEDRAQEKVLFELYYLQTYKEMKEQYSDRNLSNTYSWFFEIIKTLGKVNIFENNVALLLHKNAEEKEDFSPITKESERIIKTELKLESSIADGVAYLKENYSEYKLECIKGLLERCFDNSESSLATIACAAVHSKYNSLPKDEEEEDRKTEEAFRMPDEKEDGFEHENEQDDEDEEEKTISSATPDIKKIIDNYMEDTLEIKKEKK